MITVKVGDEVISRATLAYEVTDTAVAKVENGELIAVGVGKTSMKVKATYDGQEASVDLIVVIVEKSA